MADGKRKPRDGGVGGGGILFTNNFRECLSPVTLSSPFFLLKYRSAILHINYKNCITISHESSGTFIQCRRRRRSWGDSRREQWPWKTQQRFQSPEGVKTIIVSTYKSLRAELMTHIKRGWLATFSNH